MRILVTGGAGYIGSHVCKELQRAGHQPVAFDNLSLGHLWAVQWGPLVQADVTDVQAVQRALQEHRIEAVMHFAAVSTVGESVQRPDLYYRHNLLGTWALLEAMRAAKVQNLVLSSSAAVYGKPTQTPIPESHRLQPTNPYGSTKLAAETMVSDYQHAFGLRAVALRYFNAAGADAQSDIGEDHTPETHLLPLALRAALGTGAELVLHGNDYGTYDGTCIRDFIHVTDLALAHLAALRALLGGKTAPVYNLGTGQGCTVNELCAAVQRVTGQRVPRKVGPRRPGDPAELVADAGRARKELGWSPQHSTMDNIIQTAWAWELKRQLEAR